MNFILLDSFVNYIDAHILLGRMQEEGIQCWLKDENTVTIDPLLTNAVGGIKLMVADDQFEKAKALWLQFREEKKQYYACPKCKSHEIELISTPRKASNWISALTSYFIGGYPLTTDQVWHCFKCNAEFEEPLDTSFPVVDDSSE